MTSDLHNTAGYEPGKAPGQGRELHRAESGFRSQGGFWLAGRLHLSGQATPLPVPARGPFLNTTRCWGMLLNVPGRGSNQEHKSVVQNIKNK